MRKINSVVIVVIYYNFFVSFISINKDETKL